MTDWLSGVQRLLATDDGGPQDTRYRAKLVLHTTEGGGTVDDLFAFYHKSTYWPHFTVDLANRRIAQHIPYSRGGRALSHPGSHVPTNDANCIQIEIIGHAVDAPLWAVASVQWFGRTMAPMLDELKIARAAPKFVGYPASAGYGFVGRFSEPTWLGFCGVCGHEHVPENDHGDPGAMNITAFLEASVTTPTTKVPPEFTPAHPTRPEISDVDCPTGGAWGVTNDGAVQTHGSAPFHGGPYGDARVKKPFSAARIELPNAAEKAAGDHYTVISSDGHRYAY